MTAALTVAQLDALPAAAAAAQLEGVYERSPWVAQAALAGRPFHTRAGLQEALAAAVDTASHAARLELLRAHPQLAGKALVAGTLTAESNAEQSRSGLTHCNPQEFARLHQLNAAYEQRFGWPFILAVRGPDGRGLTRAEIIAAFEHRLHAAPGQEFEECLRNVHQIAAWRLHDRFEPGPCE